MTDDIRMYGEFEVEYMDSDGNVLETATVEDASGFTLDDIKLDAMVHQVDQIHVEMVEMGTKRGDTQITRYRRADNEQ